MNEERKQLLIEDIRERSKPDLFEVFDETSFIKIVDILSLSDEKAFNFAGEIQVAFMVCNPKHFSDKEVFPSTQARLIESLLDDHKSISKKLSNKISLLKELPLSDDNARAARKKRKEYQWILLQTLRDAEVYRETGKQVVNRYGRNLEIKEYTHEMYEFDKKIADLIEQLSWFKQVATIAHKKVKAEVGKKKKGGQTNHRVWKFFLWLCNIYYKYAGETPEIAYTDGKVWANGALKFSQDCYKGFGMKPLTDIAAYKKFNAISEGKQPKELSGFAADWLVPKATF